MGVVVYEGVSPKGHVVFNKEYFNILAGTISAAYIGTSVSKHYDTYPHIVFDDSFVNKNRLKHAIGFLIQSIKILLQMKRSNSKKLILLSYDIVALPFLTLLAKVLFIELYTIEHNTIPVNYINRFIQKMCFRNVCRICLTPNSAKVFKLLGGKSRYINLPLVKLNRAKNFPDKKRRSSPNRPFVFCPSINSDLKVIYDVAAANKDLDFLVKSEGNSLNLPNVKCVTYFNNYLELMESCEIVFIPYQLAYRVSGPLFEAVSLNKKVLLLPGNLYDYASLCFKNNVFPLKSYDISALVKLTLDTNAQEGIIREHNFKVKEDLYELIGL